MEFVTQIIGQKQSAQGDGLAGGVVNFKPVAATGRVRHPFVDFEGGNGSQARGLVLLVIHGDGPDAWHADRPKAKFVIINLPFKEVRLRKLSVKRKNVIGIYAEETGSDNMTSVTFWDGRKYRYTPLGAGLD